MLGTQHAPVLTMHVLTHCAAADTGARRNEWADVYREEDDPHPYPECRVTLHAALPDGMSDMQQTSSRWQQYYFVFLGPL